MPRVSFKTNGFIATVSYYELCNRLYALASLFGSIILLVSCLSFLHPHFSFLHPHFSTFYSPSTFSPSPPRDFLCVLHNNLFDFHIFLCVLRFFFYLRWCYFFRLRGIIHLFIDVIRIIRKLIFMS